MKQTFTLLFLMLLSVSNAFAQKRLVLIEEFTNDGCGPCARYSPTLDAVIDERLGDVIAVKYHGNYPDPDDPIYLAQKETLDKRRSFYQVNAFPTTFMNGDNLGNGLSSSNLNNAISYYMQEPDNYSIEASYTIAGGKISIQTKTIAKQDVNNSNLRLFAAVVEEHINCEQALPNGETELNFTCRQLLPNGDGYQLPSTIKSGESNSYNTDWTIQNINDTTEIGLVVFLQDIATKKILATAYVPKKAQGEDSIAIKSLTNTPDLICTPNYYGSVVVRNDGSNNIKSAILNVEVNGSKKTYSWTGDLAYLQRDTINFDDFTDFTLNEDGSRNSVNVWLSNINGGDKTSNTLSQTFSSSAQATGAVQLKLYTDKAPQETTWKLYNSDGEVVQQGGPYSEGRHFYTEDFALTHDDCYTLQFLDAGGNGITGSQGNGYYQLYQINADGTKKRITQGDYDGASYDVRFHLKGANAALTGIQSLTTTEESAKKCNKIYDLQGKKVVQASPSEVYISNGKKIIRK